MMGNNILAFLLAESPGSLECVKALWTNDLGADKTCRRNDDAAAAVGHLHGLVIRVTSLIQAHPQNLIEASLLQNADELFNKGSWEDRSIDVGELTLRHELELGRLKLAIEDAPGVRED